MAIFIFSAARNNGATITGEREAENEIVLARMLKQDGLFLLQARPKEDVDVVPRFNIDVGALVTRFRPISLVERMFFTRNLAVMIGAGLPLTRALDALAEESISPRFQKVINAVNASIVEGKSFTDSLKPYPKVFNNLFVHMVEVGEATGKLQLILRLLGQQMKKDYDLKKRIRGAMIYPAIILSVLVIVGTLMMIYVIPTLSATIKDLGGDLPITTRIVIALSDFIQRFILWVIVGGAAVGFVFWRAAKTNAGKQIFDRLILKMPIFGRLIMQFNIARFCRTLAYLVTAGVPIVRSLEITGGVVGNVLYQNAIKEAAVEIEKGRQLHEILRRHRAIFFSLVIYMLKVGEETGQISNMLLRLALFFEEDVANTTRNLSTVIEPLLMLVIGAAVAFFAISMLQPIYGSLGNFS